MKIIILALGSRGDVQPYIAFAHGLKAAGYTVTIAVGEDFEQWVTDEGFTVQVSAINIQDLIQTDMGKDLFDNPKSNIMTQIKSLRQLMVEINQVLTPNLHQMVRGYDVVVSNLLTYALIDSLAEIEGFAHICAVLQPVIPTREYISSFFYLRQTDSWLNKAMGYFVLWSFWFVMGRGVNHLRRDHHLMPLTMRDFFQRIVQARMLKAVSPTVMPHASDWDAQKVVTGYWVYQRREQWQAPPSLVEFLAAGHAPIYVGFGSMSSHDPESTTILIIEALQRSGQRGIIYKGWAGLNTDDVPDTIYLLDGAPHDWLFPQMRAIVHHGGAGTTASALRAGRPQTIIAHGGDQPYFGRRMHELGVGMPFVHRRKLNIDRLVQVIRGMIDDPQIAQRASVLAQQIHDEDGVMIAVQQVNTWLDVHH